MIKVLTNLLNDGSNKSKLKKIIPSYGYELNNDPALLKRIRTKTYKQLGLW